MNQVRFGFAGNSIRAGARQCERRSFGATVLSVFALLWLALARPLACKKEALKWCAPQWSSIRSGFYV
jgi:hypothetical protein